MFDPVFQGRSRAALPGGVAGTDRYPTLPPSAFSDLAAWFRFGMGITVTGAGVSQWDDQSGNGRHLKQGTDAARPPKQTDGSILFDGTAQYLKCDAFTLNQPESVYLLMRQVTWTIGDQLFDGDANGSGQVFQRATSPNLALFAGTTLGSMPDLALNTYGVIAGVFNGASSVLQINNGASTVGNAGAANMGGFTLGANGAVGTFSNIQVKEVIICSTAHDGTRRAQMLAWLNSL